MTRHTKRIVIALRSWPLHPPLLPSIKIAGRSILIPGVRDFCFGPIGASCGGVRNAGASVCRSRGPKGCDACHGQARRQNNSSPYRGIHGDGLPLLLLEYTSSVWAPAENSIRGKAKIL